jgi:hypothetical protein
MITSNHHVTLCSPFLVRMYAFLQFSAHILSRLILFINITVGVRNGVPIGPQVTSSQQITSNSTVENKHCLHLPFCTWAINNFQEWYVCRLLHLGSSYTLEASASCCFTSRKTMAILPSISRKMVNSIRWHFWDQ